jgi:hypothetical protein
MVPHRTTPGRYVIHSYKPYTTASWQLSRLSWGTKLKIDASGKHLLYETGLTRHPWAPVETLVPIATLPAIAALYKACFGTSRRYDADGDGIPEVWVFNDFGPFAVRYFVDKNRNKRLDTKGGERLSGEMIHTTPVNEGQVQQGNPVALRESHGCIHVSPGDRDRFLAEGAFAQGNDLVVHGYDEMIPDALKSPR